MSANTKIEWADHTFNPWVGCTKVGLGCYNCYAESWAKRSGLVQWGPGAARVRTKTWGDPVRWNKQEFVECAACAWRGDFRTFMVRDSLGFDHSMCPRCGGVDYVRTRARVFCASLADVFDNEVPDAWRVDLLRLIEKTPNLDWLLLTKRIGNVERLLDNAARLMDEVMLWPMKNVWLGITVVNQEEADRDIPKLLQVPAAKRFLSIEPMLGAIDLSQWLFDFAPCHNCPCPTPEKSMNGYEDCCPDPEMRPSKIDWVIAGGESGPHARPAHPDWFRSLRDQCGAAGVPFLFKQWGEWAPQMRDDVVVDSHRWPIEPREPSGGVWSYRIGKKNAGRILDGRTHDGFPS